MTASEQVDHTLTDLCGSQPRPQDLLKAGDKISHYVISRELGRGGMGAVYLATHGTVDVQVAIKILPPALAYANPDAAARFLREARLAANLVHPHVIKMIDCGKDPDSNIFYLVQEFVEGGSVKDRIANGPIPDKQAHEWLVQITGALQAANAKKIIHRDIKPDNILLTADGEAKLADLGLAKDLTSSTAHLTQSNVGIGTPAYMSPEQISDAKNVDIRSDIYSLGATFFHMVTGRAPYMGASVINILNKVINEPVPNPQAINPNLNSLLARICMKMIQKEPEQRFQTPEDVLRALAAEQAPPEFNTTSLESVGRAAPQSADQRGFVSHAQSRVADEDRLAPIAIGALVILTLILGSAIFMVMGRDDQTEDSPEIAAKNLDTKTKTVKDSNENPPVKKGPIPDPPIPEPKLEPKPDPAPVEKTPTPVPVEKTPKPIPNPDSKLVKELAPSLLKGLRFAVGFNKQVTVNGELRVRPNFFAEDLAAAASFAVQPRSLISESGRKTVFQAPPSTATIQQDFKTRSVAFWAKASDSRTAVIVDSGANSGVFTGLNLGVFGGVTYGKWAPFKPGFFLGLWHRDFVFPVTNQSVVDTWHFMAVSISDTSIRVMIDGDFPIGYFAGEAQKAIELTQPFQKPQKFKPRTSAGLRIGESHNHSSDKMRPYLGFIDDVAIWDRPLTIAELKSLYDYSKKGQSYCEALERLKR
ncbi:MAG: protein kinase [Planctomycetota bacterium]|nr:protein kinase [Planctomycetota bacterium]